MRSTFFCLTLIGLTVVALQHADGQAEWNLLVYLNGDNNLENCAINDFLEMAVVGSTSDVNVIVQLDRKPGFNSQWGDWTDTRRFRIGAGMTPDPGNELMILGEINSGQGPMTSTDDGSVEDFIRWACTNYPAQRNAFVFWNHGFGWRAAGDDWTEDDKLWMPEVREALTNAADAGIDMHLIGFNECLMAMLEVAHEIQPLAEVMVGSEMVSSEGGFPYDLILADLVANPTMDSRTLGETIVTHYGTTEPDLLLSAIDLREIPPLVAAVNDLALVMTENKADIETARLATHAYGSPGGNPHIDLYNFVDLLSQQIPSGAIHDAAVNVMNNFQAPFAVHGKQGRDHGLAIYFSKNSLHPLHNQYNNDWLLFAGDTHWDEFIRWYHGIEWLCCLGDLVPGNPVEIRVVGEPGADPVTFAFGWTILDPPYPTIYGDLYISLPPAAVIQRGPMPADGIMIIPQTVPTVWQSGEKYPVQALIGPLQWGSTLTNLMVLNIE